MISFHNIEKVADKISPINHLEGKFFFLPVHKCKSVNHGIKSEKLTFPHQPEENVISSEPKPIWSRINDVPAQLTDAKTSDPLLYTSFLSFDTMITD